MTDPTEAIRKAHAAYAATDMLSPERRIALDDFYAACNPAAIRALLDRLDSAERDAGRLDWCEQNPLKFLELVLGKCPDGSDGLKVEARLSGEVLPSGALAFTAPRWGMREAIDAALRAGEQKEPK